MPPKTIDRSAKDLKFASPIDTHRVRRGTTLADAAERIGATRRLHHFFERQCDADPDAPALVCDGQRMSYAALDARANRLARHLNRRGLRPGGRAGILLDRSVHTYAALLAVLKCGAAFVPIDLSFPRERIAFLAADAELDLLATTSEFADSVAGVGCTTIFLDRDAATIAGQLSQRLLVPDEEDALCYIIYTSGSTGRPKGVAVNHSSVCNFLDVCTPIYGVGPGDRVYQGMTISFDFSIEEIWPTFAAGATLIAGPTDHRRLGPALAEFLIAQRVSVLCCVPTLLATLDRDVPGLHTLLVGGEACPRDLVKRWSRPGRRMLNTYGPTETTVTATWSELRPDRPVTIGKPMPTYTVHILDDALRPVRSGESGEICIGGPGVACGYVHRPELTASRFVADGFDGRPGARLYRTGDLGRFTRDGEIEFLGRIDSQVKVRGYRVELAEIEAILLECAEVENTVVALIHGDAGEELAAYLTLRDRTADTEELKRRLHGNLRGRVPAYMVPAFLEVLDALPTLPSGKADRSRLPRPASSRLGTGSSVRVPPATPREQELAAAWGAVFGRTDLSVEADFFEDLGGHSLLAALLVSKLRQTPELRHLALRDVYAHPTIRSLARHSEATTTLPKGSTPDRADRPAPLRHPSRRVLLCGVAQVISIYLLWVLLGAPLALQLSSGVRTPMALLTAAALTVVASMVFAVLLPLAAKWLLIGRFRPGRWRLWGWFYCRWWLVRKLLEMAPLDLLSGSPLLPLYLRLLGARIGAGCHLGTGRIHLPDLVEIGAGASLGYGVEVQPFLVEDGWLSLAPIRLGADSFVGTNSLILLGGSVGRGARLLEQSLVARDQVIPDGETWAGSPSERRDGGDALLDEMASEATTARCWPPSLWLGFLIGLVALELLPLAAALPGLLFAFTFADGDPVRGLAAAPVAGLSFVLTACALVAAGKRLILWRIRPGTYPLCSLFGLRKWLVDKLMMSSLAMTNTLYATLYTLPWLRLLGAKVGSRSEVSTVSHIDPDLLVLGRESFVADLAVIGAARYHAGRIALGPTQLGCRCFVGNAALVPGDTRLADGTLIGVHSVPPAEPAAPGTSWLGSPAIFLPRRQSSGSFAESVTYHPPGRLVAARLAVEFFRVVLPSVLLNAAVLLGTLASQRLAVVLSPLTLTVVLPLLYLASALLVVSSVVVLKWLTVGRYRPRVEPLWSHFVWRTELITGLYESAAAPALFRWLTGTPLLRLFLRLLGARIGRRVYLETTFLTEFDLVRVGDDAAIGGSTSLQTHLFEDRVMKMSVVTVGPGCTVGPRAVVLYDSSMGAGSELDGLSLLMKGESLPPDSRWRGIPARLAE